MITIRKATVKDAQKISYLIQKNTTCNPNNYSDEQMQAWKKYNTPSKIKEQFKSREIYCAFRHNKLIGTIGLQSNEIVGFYVSYSQRGKGVGKQLFNFIQNKIINKGFNKLLLTATPSAVNFYKQNGFVLLKTITVAIETIKYKEFTMHKNLN